MTTSTSSRRLAAKPRSGRARREAVDMYLFISPWLIGFLVFTAGPMIASIVISLLNWNLLRLPAWRGLGNYVEIFERDSLFTKSLLNTVYYTFGSVPLHLVLALVVAMLLNTRVRGLAVYRTIFYIPSVFSGVAVALMWIRILHPNVGLVNQALAWLHIKGPNWLGDSHWAMPAMILMSLWGGIGTPMVIFLAGLQAVPRHLHEAAEVDGAGWWAKLRHITLPMLSPIIFFNLVMGIIGSFQVFGASYILTGGGPNYATYTYMLKIYHNAFCDFRMGYASALAWILFGILVAFTCLQFSLGSRWVYYETKVVGGT